MMQQERILHSDMLQHQFIKFLEAFAVFSNELLVALSSNKSGVRVFGLDPLSNSNWTSKQLAANDTSSVEYVDNNFTLHI